MKFIDVEELKSHLIRGTSFLDVRAPVEFIQGSIPGAQNIAILNDEERALIGTTYKEKGNAEAVRLGHEIVSGENKNLKLQQWKIFFEQNPDGILYCFRGGQRSQITQRWLLDAGVDRPLIKGGYKASRQMLMDQITKVSLNKPFVIVSGATGSGKTDLINDVKAIYPSLDLEGAAHHRGSAFGGMNIPQPTQVNFENAVALELLKLEKGLLTTNPAPLLVEDESRMIGQNVVPEVMFDKMRASSLVMIDESVEKRTENIFKDYILFPIQNGENFIPRYEEAFRRITKKLGGLRTQELTALLLSAHQEYLQTKNLELHKEWIRRLLVEYYDPLYFKSFQKRNSIVIFKGSRAEVTEYLMKHTT